MTACSICCAEKADSRVTFQPDADSAFLTFSVGPNCRAEWEIDGPVIRHRWMGRMAARQQRMIAAASEPPAKLPNNEAHTSSSR